MVEIGEALHKDVYPVSKDNKAIGHIARLFEREWAAIPLHYRNLPLTIHKLRRDAITALGR